MNLSSMPALSARSAQCSRGAALNSSRLAAVVAGAALLLLLLLWCAGGMTMHPPEAQAASFADPARSSSPSGVRDGFKVGDAVEAYNIGWYKGRVVELGTGKKYTGDYLVDFDDFSTNQWFDAKNVRAVQVPKVYSGPPRAGKYLVMGYGSNPSNPLHLGYFVLKGGKEYRFHTLSGKLIGAGGYRFDAASKTVNWLSGPFKKNKWKGKFEITREGKTHTISVNRATIGTNSSD